jgi:ribosomal-protein-alanine N-acetyltransferase
MIETERLYLRPFHPDELGALVAFRADPEVSRYLGDAAMHTPESVAQRFEFYLSCYETHGFGASAVIRKADGEMIGWGGLQPLEATGEIEIGYGFAKLYWGQGFATEMAQAWFRYGFERVGLERIVAVAEPENTASWRVMEKLGMRYEGRAQHYGKECVKYAISREQFHPADALYILHDEKRDER